MKKLYKFIILAITISFVGCSEIPKDPTVESNGFNLNKDNSIVSATVLTPTNDTNVFGKFSWDISNNGPSSPSTYTLVVFDHDNDSALLNPSEYTGNGTVVTTDSRNSELTNKEFNDLINKLPTFRCGQMNIDVRIKSTLGANPETAFVQYSNPISYTVTPYSLSKPVLSFVINGATPANSINLVSTDYLTLTDFESYSYLQPGNYNFYKPDPCGDFAGATVLGGAAGALSVGGAAINVPTAGFYLIKANLVANTYSIKDFTTVTIYGRATRAGATGFTNNVPLTYNSTNKTWTATLDLINGQTFKFKTIKWPGGALTAGGTVLPAPDYIPTSALTVTSTLGGITGTNALVENNSTGDIKAPGVISGNTTTKYLITVNLNNPRNYTYSLLKQ